MEITEVRVKLVNVKNDKLRAFCSITVDNDFVIRDLKVIEGAKGAFVAMPSRKLSERCGRCGGKNHCRARYCNDCGARLAGDRSRGGPSGQKMHTDIAHPINSRCREVIQQRVLEVYEAEVQKSVEPGYQPMSLDVFDEEALTEETSVELAEQVPAPLSSCGEGPGPTDPGGNGGVEAADQPPLESAASGSGVGEVPGAPQGAIRERRGGGEGGRHPGPHRDGGAHAPSSQRGGDGDRGRGRSRRGFRGGSDRGGSRGDGGQQGERRGAHGGRRDPDRPHDRAFPPRSLRRDDRGFTPDSSRGDDQGRDRERGRFERDRSGQGEGPGTPENDRQNILGAPAPTPPRPAAKEPEPEPEDNFGAGLFN